MARPLLRALVAAVSPAALAAALAPEPAWMLWSLPLLLPAAWLVRAWANPGRVQAIVGLVLAAAAAIASARARALADVAWRDAWPRIDLATDAMPPQPPPWLEVAGVLRDGWVLGEYLPGPGQVADQSQPARAVLAPMTGADVDVVTLQGAIVIARVRADAARGPGRVVLRGHTEPLAPELAQTLVDLGGTPPGNVPAVLLDTLQVPQSQQASVAVALALGLLLAAIAAFAWREPAPRDAGR
ncbi:MAG: hypothetical protein K1X88_10355 [Nannocystaceae bacterium]|nr:hypothetical protein [Nannocystaceae bacterium]